MGAVEAAIYYDMYDFYDTTYRTYCTVLYWRTVYDFNTLLFCYFTNCLLLYTEGSVSYCRALTEPQPLVSKPLDC